MKSAKKLLLLVLSLVLLIGVFAVAALAEDSATETQTATVVYPDGTTRTVNVGDTIVGKEFENGFYQGAGNTLFKDDATAGWTFTLEGETNALTDLTVTEAMAGKVILAGGADKVYATAEITINEGNYAIWLGGTQYVVSGTTAVSDGTTLETAARKIPVGTHTLYFMNDGELASFLTTACSFEIDGVTYTYQDIRSLSRNTVKIKMYEDATISDLTWSTHNNDRPQTTLPAAGKTAAGGTAATVYLDFNGHSITSTRKAIIDFRSMTLYLYSSVKGANLFGSAATDTFIYPNNDGKLYFGEDADSTTAYNDNINFYMKSLSSTAYGGGIYIQGGRYYQTAGGENFISINQRVYAFQNAKFFLQSGGRLLVFDGTSTSQSLTMTKCEIYTSGAADLLYAATNSGGTVGKVTVTANNCSFYGVSKNFVKPAEDAIAPVINAVSTEEGGTNTFGAAITYNTVAWHDGTTDSYFATDAEDAKAFVENHPKAALTPFYMAANENELSFVYGYALNVNYENSNATVTRIGGTVVKIYYTVTYTDGTVDYYTGTDYTTKLTKVFGAFPSGATVTLYTDVTHTSATMMSAVDGGNAYLDLNGHLWKLTGTGSPTLEIGPTSGKAIKLYIYSSAPGGKIYAPSAGYLTRTNTYGTLYLGERSISSTQYGANLTVETTRVNGDLYGSGIGIYGGTYVQVANSAYNYMFVVSRVNGTSSQFFAMKNATFVLNKANSSAIHWINAGFNSIANCTFVGNASGATPICNATTNATAATKTPTFDSCKFINVNPAASLLGDKYPIYRNCVFSLTDAITTAVYSDGTTTTPLYLAKINATDSITYGDFYYPVNYALMQESEFLTVTWLDGTHPYWALGTSPISDTPMENEIEKQADGTYVVICDRFYYPTGITVVVEANLGTTVSELSTPEGRTFPIAFSYQVEGSLVQYAPLLETADANGEQFVSLLNNLSNVKIVMYTDIVLYNGVLFGTMEITYGEPYKDKDGADRIDATATYTSGDVDWDLNGHTVTIDETAKPLVMTSWQESQYTKPTHNVFHYLTGKHTIKLYSSVPGGEYINNNKTAHAIFGINKYADLVPSVLLGTSDIAHDGGNNLKMTSNIPFCFAYETGGDGPEGYTLGVNGGTYVYGGAVAAFVTAQNAKFYNATIVTTGAAKSVFISHYYRAGKIDASGCTIVASNSTTSLAEQGYLSDLQLTYDSYGKNHVHTFTDCTIVGAKMSATYTPGWGTINFAGETFVDNAENFAVAYPEIPTDKTLAYSSAIVYGEIVKVYGYCLSENVAIVAWGNGFESEYWKIGATATHVGGIIVDEFFGYAYAPFVVVAGENTPTYDKTQVAALKSDTIIMSLTLQSQIGLNLFFTEGLTGATIKVGGTAVTLGEAKDGYYAFTKALAPNLANSEITIEITLANGSTHTVKISLATYAKAILKSTADAHKAAHNLTYAMVEYVRAMTGDVEFCKDAKVPADYKTVSIPALTPATEAADGENTASGYFISFQLDDAIAIAVKGGTTETVTLKIANRTFTKDMKDGTVVFDLLFVNELYNGFSVTIGETTYEYSLVEYYYAMEKSEDAMKIAALYNYAHYAFAYVRDNL